MRERKASREVILTVCTCIDQVRNTNLLTDSFLERFRLKYMLGYVGLGRILISQVGCGAPQHVSRSRLDWEMEKGLSRDGRYCVCSNSC